MAGKNRIRRGSAAGFENNKIQAGRAGKIDSGKASLRYAGVSGSAVERGQQEISRPGSPPVVQKNHLNLHGTGINSKHESDGRADVDAADGAIAGLGSGRPVLALDYFSATTKPRGGSIATPGFGVFFHIARDGGIRPNTWLAVRSLEPQTVRATLKDKNEFFISPRVNGWVIVTGRGLPNPSDDVDACHLFLTALSRELGHVQFFHTDKIFRASRMGAAWTTAA